MGKRLLRRNSRLRGYHHPLLAVDFENNPDTGDFICAGVSGMVYTGSEVKREGKRVKRQRIEVKHERYFTDQRECLDYLMSLPKNGCLIVTFNLSYDRFYLDDITDHSTALCNGARCITLKLRNGLRVIDLANHVDGSLEDWIGYLGMESEGISKAKLTDYYNRVMNDARATHRLGVFLEDFYYDVCNIPLGLTVGSCALRIFTAHHFRDYWQRSNDVLSNYERTAYYGGRCEVFKRGIRRTWSYDVNSNYASIMADNTFPDMQSAVYIETPPADWQRYLEKYDSIWTLHIRAPADIRIPVLPVRYRGKLCFPTGDFIGTWCSPELREAIAAGYDVLEVKEGIYYRKSKPYFRDFALWAWDRRCEFKAAGNRGMQLMIKKLPNSLYGKFAQRNADEYFGRLSDYDGELDGQYRFHEWRGEVWLQISKGSTPALHEFPAISAMVTSHARVKLWRSMNANAEAMIYCDTDSIKLTQPARGITIGAGLGEWSLEVDGEDICYMRPKLYGEHRKGVPARAVMVYEDSDIQHWEFKKPLRYREAIKNGVSPNIWRTVTKCLSLLDDKRLWHGSESKPIPLWDFDGIPMINTDEILIDERYKDTLRLESDRDIIPAADRLAADAERQERRRLYGKGWGLTNQ